jgi:membrane-associated phospholipid phosphatase
MLINIVYSNDLPDNLAPSGHVMCTWLIFMACRNKTAKGKYNYWLYTITLIYGVWMFFNILTVRQHYIIDGIMSIALCEICWVLFIKTNFWVFFANGSDKLSFASAYHHDGYFTSYGKNQNNVYVNHYLKLGKCMTWILASLFCAIWVYFLLTSVLGDPFKQFWKWTSFSI